MRIIYIVSLLLFSFTNLIWAQRSIWDWEYTTKANANWIFCDSGHIQINNGVPQFKTSPLAYSFWDFKSGASGVSISDTSTGELLFYTDGEDLYNPDGSYMIGGNLLKGSEGRTEHGAVIVPNLEKDSSYFLFTIGFHYFLDFNNPEPFFYVHEISYDNTLKQYAISFRDSIISQDYHTSGITVLPGNNCGLWVIVRELFPYSSTYSYNDLTSTACDFGNELIPPSKKIKAYHITSQGINTTPVISEAMQKTCVQFGGMNLIGSPTSQHMVSYLRADIIEEEEEYIGMNGFELMNFDLETGKLSNPIMINNYLGNRIYRINRMEFSPNGQYLYALVVARPEIESEELSLLVQYDLSTFDSLSIYNSAIIIDTFSTGVSDLKTMGQHIYIGHIFNEIIDVIEEPNKRGKDCKLVQHKYSLYENTMFKGHFPHTVKYPHPSSTTSLVVIDTSVCISNSPLELAINHTGAENIAWNTGATNNKIAIHTPGKYWASYSVGCNFHIDTFEIRNKGLEEVPTISVSEKTLSVPEVYSRYQWLLNDKIIEGALAPRYDVTQNGSYRVIIYNAEGCFDTTQAYIVNNANLNSISTLNFAVYPNPANDWIMIKSDEPATVQIIDALGKVQSEFTLIRDYSLSVKNLPKGHYMIKAQAKDSGKIFITKLVIY